MALSVDIRKTYPGFDLDVRFTAKSRRIGILGGSGSGKSMTLRSIAGIHTPDEGRIVLDGRILYDRARRVDLKPQLRRVGYLFQNYALFPNMTVRDNIISGMRSHKNENTPRLFGLGKKITEKHADGWHSEQKARADALILRFHLEGLEDRLPAKLSGGQQQRVALARILASEPEAILLDEPFSALDWYLKDQMQRELAAMLSDYPGTVILVSHDRDEIYRFAEELLVLSEGKIIRLGPTGEVFADPQSREAAALTGCKNFSRAKRLNAHQVKALNWGITLTFREEVPQNLRYLGFRAHDFRPVWGGSRVDNAIRCRVVSEAKLQFEHNYYIAPESDDPADKPLCWFLQKSHWEDLAGRGLPDYLVLPEEALMFLE